MLRKISPGIKIFVEEKGYGKWSFILLPQIQSRESCEPKQATEPFASLQGKRNYNFSDD